ncbi:hypothetical protein Lalb_Chr02g0150681 [Lupinus albus]|uniref:Uncharacterized protein n=1 Tax=Lupinus albus TaxID=3870 RepID=A0A6A4R1A2_LUPAL|nr:hypothetical protein Lalb_Chr02g0150681 [Lupinus albus]
MMRPHLGLIKPQHNRIRMHHTVSMSKIFFYLQNNSHCNNGRNHNNLNCKGNLKECFLLRSGKYKT